MRKCLVPFSGTYNAGLDMLLVCRITKANTLSNAFNKNVSVPLFTNGGTEAQGVGMTCQGNWTD